MKSKTGGYALPTDIRRGKKNIEMGQVIKEKNIDQWCNCFVELGSYIRILNTDDFTCLDCSLYYTGECPYVEVDNKNIATNSN
jgi:hypothetical protein